MCVGGGDTTATRRILIFLLSFLQPMEHIRAILRLLPCRTSELARFRSEVIEVARAANATTDAKRLGSETLYMMRAQQTLMDLNAKYFPQSGMSEQEVVAATAARVGLQLPKSEPPPEPTPRPGSPSSSSS